MRLHTANRHRAARARRTVHYSEFGPGHTIWEVVTHRRAPGPHNRVLVDGKRFFIVNEVHTRSRPVWWSSDLNGAGKQ